MMNLDIVNNEVNAMIEALDRPLTPEDVRAGWNDNLRRRWHDWFVQIKGMKRGRGNETGTQLVCKTTSCVPVLVRRRSWDRLFRLRRIPACEAGNYHIVRMRGHLHRGRSNCE